MIRKEVLEEEANKRINKAQLAFPDDIVENQEPFSGLYEFIIVYCYLVYSSIKSFQILKSIILCWHANKLLLP